MLIWIFLSLIVIAVSFLLALRSMRNFKEFPARSKLDYSVYLIKNEEAVTTEFIKELFTRSRKDYPEFVISLERLFKGNQKALVIFAPRFVIQTFTSHLNLLELEDYSLKDYGQFLAWEMGSKDQVIPFSSIFPSSEDFLKLTSSEQIWWQVVMQPAKLSGDKLFKVNIRVVVWGETNKKAQDLQDSASKVGKLLLLPDPSTSEARLKLFRERVFATGISLNSMEIN